MENIHAGVDPAPFLRCDAEIRYSMSARSIAADLRVLISQLDGSVQLIGAMPERDRHGTRWVPSDAARATA